MSMFVENMTLISPGKKVSRVMRTEGVNNECIEELLLRVFVKDFLSEFKVLL